MVMLKSVPGMFADLFTDVFGLDKGKFNYFYKALVVNIVFWILFVSGVFLLITDLIFKRSVNFKKYFFLLACAIPVTSICFYRNSYPYYYVFIMMPAALLCAVTWDRLIDHNAGFFKYIVFVTIVGMLFFINIFVVTASPRVSTLPQQKQMLSVIHQIFPEPVAYIDRNSMVSSFMKKGFFMSTWGFETYYENGQPVLRDVIDQDAPKFLLANKNSLDFMIEGYDENVPEYVRLMPEDKQALRENYIHHWTKLYVPGKYFVFSGQKKKERFYLNIPGYYTIESARAVKIDGKRFNPLDFVDLKKGEHTIEYPGSDESIVTLRWGKRIMRPEPLSEEKNLYYSF